MERQDQQTAATDLLRQGAADEAVERLTSLPLQHILELRAYLATMPPARASVARRPAELD